MDRKKAQKEESYEGEHKELFEEFYCLVDDSVTQANVLLELLPWRQVRSILSVGGGEGNIEGLLLQSAPKASISYLDPSAEQCQAIRDHMARLDLADRVGDISQTTFQDYDSQVTFDRIVSIYSWFYVGTESRWLQKLLDLLAPGGAACLILPNAHTTENEFAGDSHIPLCSNKLFDALQTLPCTVERHTHTRWLSAEKLFDGEKLTSAARAFVSFISRRGYEDFSAEEWRHAYSTFHARLEPQGVPLIWDALIVDARRTPTLRDKNSYRI